jgi:membrane-associated phospholipid phosphatase
MALTDTRAAGSAPPPSGVAPNPGPVPPSVFRPMDWLAMAYLAATFVLLAVFHRAAPRALPLAALHLSGIAAIVILRRTPLCRYRLTRIVLDFYPLPLFALLYSELAVVDRLLHPTAFFDAPIQRFEGWFFRTQPSQVLHVDLPYRWLGEYLHLGYLSYYSLGPVLVITLWFRRPREQFERAIATIGLAFILSFGFFIAVPVTGPFHAFGPIDPSRLGVFLPRVTRWLLDRGSSLGTAFPSSHVAVSTTTWIMAMRYHRRIAFAYLFLVPALAMGAIYGGYHYATDVTAGAVLAVVTGTLGHRLVAAIQSRGDARGQSVPVEGGGPASSRSREASTLSAS